MRAVGVDVRALTAGHGDPARDAPVLADVELALPPGGRLAVVGRSACGKSTLLHVLAGLLPAWRGEVRVDGAVVGAGACRPNGRAARGADHAAYMFQQDLLMPWKTVLGNATFAAAVARRPAAGEDGRRGARCGRAGGAGAAARAGTLLAEFGLGDVLGALPRDLSGGMRQRVALARTLTLGRGLVLLDEPFGSLDALTRADMRRWLLDAMREHPATWVLVTHDVHEAVLLGDRVAVLKGRPARLEGWFSVPLSESERRSLARREAGEAAPPGAAAGAPAPAGHAKAEAAAQVVRGLSTQILDLLMTREAA